MLFIGNLKKKKIKNKKVRFSSNIMLINILTLGSMFINQEGRDVSSRICDLSVNMKITQTIVIIFPPYFLCVLQTEGVLQQNK